METIIIFVWVLFKFRRPGFGVEMDILRESLQVEKYLRARGAEEVLMGNMRFEVWGGRGMAGCLPDF